MLPVQIKIEVEEEYEHFHEKREDENEEGKEELEEERGEVDPEHKYGICENADLQSAQKKKRKKKETGKIIIIKDEKCGTAEEEKLPCNFCGQLYPKRLLTRHMKRHMTAKKEHKCRECDKSFTVKTKLMAHLQACHRVEMKCDLCDKEFHNAHSFTVHMAKHRRGKSHVCDICGFATAGRLTLGNHRLVRHQIGDFPLRCSVCQKGFLSNATLREHMNRHTGATPHQCDKCGSAYAAVRALKRHWYKCHPEQVTEKILRCELCNRIFKSGKNLEAHKNSKHPDGKRTACDICGKEFSFRESLVRHRRIHTGEKPKECSVCKKRFGCATYLQYHMRTHTGEKPYQCRFCWKNFSQRSSLVTHEKSHLKALASSGIELVPANQDPDSGQKALKLEPESKET